MAIRSNILFYTDEDGVNVSFTDRFMGFLISPSKDRFRTPVDESKPRLLGNLASMEYYTTTKIANFLGLTYEEFLDLPAKDPDKLRVIFDLGEMVHRLINSDFYECLVLLQEEQMKERAEFRKRILKK
ncbi:MAG TPA: hypothetical protein VIP70_06290 [Nitrososphaeraceae archaeon]